MGRESRLHPPHATPSGPPLDARGRPLQEGDEVLLAVHQPIYFRVVQIVPNVHPGAPPNLMLVHVGAGFPIAAAKGTINPEIVRVRSAAEAGENPFRLLDEEQSKALTGEPESAAPAEAEAAGPRLVEP